MIRMIDLVFVYKNTLDNLARNMQKATGDWLDKTDDRFLNGRRALDGDHHGGANGSRNDQQREHEHDARTVDGVVAKQFHDSAIRNRVESQALQNRIGGRQPRAMQRSPLKRGRRTASVGFRIRILFTLVRGGRVRQAVDHLHERAVGKAVLALDHHNPGIKWKGHFHILRFVVRVAGIRVSFQVIAVPAI